MRSSKGSKSSGKNDDMRSYDLRSSKGSKSTDKNDDMRRYDLRSSKGSKSTGKKDDMRSSKGSKSTGKKLPVRPRFFPSNGIPISMIPPVKNPAPLPAWFKQGPELRSRKKSPGCPVCVGEGTNSNIQKWCNRCLRRRYRGMEGRVVLGNPLCTEYPFHPFVMKPFMLRRERGCSSGQEKEEDSTEAERNLESGCSYDLKEALPRDVVPKEASA